MSYTVQLEKRAQKQLSQIPQPFLDAIDQKILALENDPRPSGCKKLKGKEGWRIRVGDYRVIYKIDDGILLVLVIEIGNRKNIYRKN
jgi:mRNA interferase RelE/StbE